LSVFLHQNQWKKITKLLKSLKINVVAGAHSVTCIDGNKLKNDRKCTPYIEKMTGNLHHGSQKGIYWWGIYYSALSGIKQ